MAVPPTSTLTPSSRISLKRVLGGVAFSLAGTCVIGGGIFVFVMWMSAEMRSVTHQFLSHVRAGEHDRAYEMTSTRLRASVPRASFPAYIDTQARDVRTTTGDWITGFAGGGDTECISLVLTGRDTFPPSLYVILIEESGSYRVDRLEPNEPEECNID